MKQASLKAMRVFDLTILLADLRYCNVQKPERKKESMI